MKNLITLLLLLLTTTTFAQTIRRVNNNPGVTGANIYATIQAAHDAAANGDIVYVEPSINAYGDLTATKSLKIYGPGYYLPINEELSADKKDVLVGSITLNTGSSGTEISGITVTPGFTASVKINVSNVTIRRCRIGGILVQAPVNASISNSLIEQNYCSVIDIVGSGSTFIVSSVIVQNNMGPSDAGLRLGSNAFTSSLVFKNNTAWEASFNNALIENNIFTREITSQATFTCTSCTVQNNVSRQTLPVGNGNQSNVLVDNEFEYTAAAILPAGVSRDEGFRLKTGSSLKTAGTGGTEVGAFGGSAPYIISGIPSIPSIPKLFVTPTGNASTPLSVTISTKSNN